MINLDNLYEEFMMELDSMTHEEVLDMMKKARIDSENSYILDILKAWKGEEKMEKMNTGNVKNIKIINTSITMADHGILTFYLHMEGGGVGFGYGGYVIGHGYQGSTSFSADNGAGLEAMMKIMDVVGVDRWEDLKGKFVRYVDRGWGEKISTIGNLIDDKWFDIDEFFSSKQSD